MFCRKSPLTVHPILDRSGAKGELPAAAGTKRRVRLIHLVLALAMGILWGCSGSRPGIADLQRYPQDLTAYLRPETEALPLVSPETHSALNADYDARFFSPWHAPAATLLAAEVFWGVAAYGGEQGYGENLQPFSPQEWSGLVAAQRMETYPSLARPAITVRNTSFRVFPTHRPFFRSLARPGEGYPFDYFQHSAVWIGTPLLVTHRSVDGAWFFAEAGFVYGWLPAEDIGWAGKKIRTSYETGRYAAILADEVSLQDETDRFLTHAHIGAVFPAMAGSDRDLRLLVPVRDADGEAVIRRVRVAAHQAELKPLPLTPAGLARIANTMLGQPYGWGGFLENRDCSATLRDLFTPFGLWLPRNSRAQATLAGTLLDLAEKTPDRKRSILLEKGIPFYTLVWLPSHIGLYLGSDAASGEPLLLHNLWGVRTVSWTGREGRALVGRLAVTSLHPGEERRDVPRNGFYGRVLGISVLPGFVRERSSTTPVPGS
jgi:hypothetical protein